GKYYFSNPKGGKISGKRKIRTGKLDFDDVYFVKELKFNLFSVSQMCDKKNSILFTDTECFVLSHEFKLPDENQVLLKVPREINMYNVNLKNIVPFGDLTCLFAKATLDESNLWHRRLGHINFKTMNKLVKGNLVRGLPSKVFENGHTCVSCKKSKQHRASYKTKPVSSINQPLQRLHIDLFGPTFAKRLNKKSYCLVVTDDYSREFSVPRTPQQNGLAERKNRTLIEAARTMLADSLLAIQFWVEAVNTACYVQNMVLVTKPQNKTPYELLHCRTPSISFMRPFGCLVTILNTLDSLGKFDGKVDEGFFVEYSVSSKAFRVFNSRTQIVQETLHVNFLKNKPNVAGSGPTWLFDIDTLTKTMNYQSVTAGNQSNPSACFSGFTNPQNTDGDVAFDEKEPEFEGRKPESKVNVSPSKFKDFSDNSNNEDNATGTLVSAVGQLSPNSTNIFSVVGPSNAAASPPHGKSSCIGTSQLPDNLNMSELEDITYSDDEDDVGAEADFNNLETSITVRPIPTTKVHKDHPVTQIIGDLSLATQTRSMTMLAKDQGHTQEEGIDYKEVFSPLARREAIRLFLAYASFMGFMVYQTNVKSLFLYGTIEEEVYVYQPPGFEDPDHPNKVYKVVKALYGLHQALRVCQDKYVAEILRKFGLTDGKSASTPIDTEKPLLQDPDGEDGRMIADMDEDVDVILEDAKEVVVEKSVDVEESADPAELQEVVEVVTTAKLLTEVVIAASATITAAAPQLTTATAPTLTTSPSAARRRNGVVIRDPEETATSSTIIHSEAKSKDKGKGILVEEPKPLKKQDQIKQDEAYARELEAELNKSIDWDEVIDHVQRKQKEDNMDYFKGITYDDIRPIIEKHFNSNMAFLLKTKEQMDEEDSKALKRLSESQEDKAAKKQKLDE
nr:hypothetical protein [Tanacetum cinerariifolium]